MGTLYAVTTGLYMCVCIVIYAGIVIFRTAVLLDIARSQDYGKAPGQYNSMYIVL